jgi:excinuclease ABC subunit B
VFYGDKMTDSMKKAISETERRRAIQRAHNLEHGIIPETIIKSLDSHLLKMANLDYFEPLSLAERREPKDPVSLDKEIKELETKMRAAAKELEFETAGQLRDRIRELRAMKIFV